MHPYLCSKCGKAVQLSELKGITKMCLECWDKRKIFKTYLVTCTITASVNAEINARSKKQAIELVKARNILGDLEDALDNAESKFTAEEF